MLLNTHSYFSLRYGILPPAAMPELLSSLGYDCVAFTDINNTSACLDFSRIAPPKGIKPVAGIDFRNGARQCFVALAENNEGFKNLNQYLSFHLHNQLPLPRRAIPMSHTFIIYPFSVFTEFEILEENEYIGVSIKDLHRLPFSAWKDHPAKLVVLHTSTFRGKTDFNVHRLLRAIENNTLLSKLPKNEEADPANVFMPKDKLVEHYRDFSFILENTERLLQKCSSVAYPAAEIHHNPETFTGSKEGDKELLTELCNEGLLYRYPSPSPEIHKRIDKEVEIIAQKGFISYFLINWDIVKHAREKGFFYVGRGSGANSIVAYLLRITDVDPVELDLYFERFINLYRQNPPDFDIDFSWADMAEMTAYIFEKFENVSLLGAYNTFQYKAVIRELGKVFGLPKHEIDALADKKAVGNRDHVSELMVKYAALIHDMPNHLSIHSSGILISQKSIHHFCATFLPPKGYATTQFDMVIAEDAGLCKFDILSQRGLGKIKDCVEIIYSNYPGIEKIDIHAIERFKKDEKVKELLRTGQAIGCFYVESPAMRMLLTKLQVDDYLGLVAASSIIRPGVSKSGMMRQYIIRHRNPERRKDAHEVMLSIMPDTYGVMVYQEDVIKVAHYFADLSLAEADVLRRGMSGKFRSREEFARVEEKFFANCLAKGIAPEMTADVWRQIASFAGYAFAKGHSASYAVESYQSLFLKAHFPLEYMVAVINNGGGFYTTELYVHEARMHGGMVHPPCINRSSYETVIRRKDIYLGLSLLSGLEISVAQSILAEKVQNGYFTSLDDFMNRVTIDLEQLILLIRIDAFRFTGIGKRELLWNAHLKYQLSKKNSDTANLFCEPVKDFLIPRLFSHPLEDAFDQMELLGFPLCSQFSLLESPKEQIYKARNLNLYNNKIITMYGYLVTIKNTKTSKGEDMNFATFIDEDGVFFDSVHFPPVMSRFPFKGRGVYAITGKVVEEFGFYCLEVSYLEKLKIVDDPRYSDKYNPKNQLSYENR